MTIHLREKTLSKVSGSDEIINKIIETEFNIETNRLISKKLEEARQQGVHGLKHLNASDEYKELIQRKSERN